MAPKKVEGTPTIRRKCDKCHNTSDHEVYSDKVNAGGLDLSLWRLGLFGIGSSLFAERVYYYRCQICGKASEMLTKEKVRDLSRGR